MRAMTGRVFVPADAAAASVGADEVAAAFEAAGAQVVRNGSRGMLWLEPLVELDTEAGRVGYANVSPDDIAAVLAGEAAGIGVLVDHPDPGRAAGQHGRDVVGRDLGVADPAGAGLDLHERLEPEHAARPVADDV